MPGPHQHDAAPAPTPYTWELLEETFESRQTGQFAAIVYPDLWQKSYFLFIFLPLDPDPDPGSR
jgi:hypothetical protein